MGSYELFEFWGTVGALFLGGSFSVEPLGSEICIRPSVADSEDDLG